MTSRGRRWFAIVAMAVIAAALYFTIRPGRPEPQSPLPAILTTPKVFDLVIAHGSLVSGPAVLSVTEGDDVTIRVVSDAIEEFHLHGYDRRLVLTAGVQAELAFKADRSGRFPFELEHARKQIGALEVQPR